MVRYCILRYTVLCSVIVCQVLACHQRRRLRGYRRGRSPPNSSVEGIELLIQSLQISEKVNLQATKLFIVTSATKRGVVTTPLDLVFGSKYCIVLYGH